jgi:hypothetical protein
MFRSSRNQSNLPRRRKRPMTKRKKCPTMGTVTDAFAGDRERFRD